MLHTQTRTAASTHADTATLAGQTGTGKTYTMEGGAAGSEAAGVIPRAFEQVFAAIQCSSEQVFLVRASFLEVYNEDIRDLLVEVR